MASSNKRPSDLSVSTARCFNSLMQFKSILVENTFFSPMVRTLHQSNKNCNKDNYYTFIKEIKKKIICYLKKYLILIKKIAGVPRNLFASCLAGAQPKIKSGYPCTKTMVILSLPPASRAAFTSELALVSRSVGPVIIEFKVDSGICLWRPSVESTRRSPV